MYNIPTDIQINGQSYPIRDNGDYRMVLDCFVALNDEELSSKERILASLIIFYDGMDDINDLNKFDDIEEAVRQMYTFFNCGNSFEENERKLPKVIDWEEDAQLICSAVNKVAGQEVRALPYLHWWTFMGYYLAIGNSPLSNIVSIRYKIARNEKLEKYERKFTEENPQYFKNINNRIDKEYDDFIKQVWNRGN